ncbi:MAG: bifunctional hydroxymethylpyrimidine kinase/phosphomethylpyrimidine kinase [Parafannyhessea sp.]|uniref:bifunctional hydroxymethylpyrimidine kinase/phosphomethylpyrimidine kinase n=1 Tax=Parafannyhessea sp. TaxID=2847324 RepID=UPI003E72B846|nr:bifunctional hydroxymethylpyrimidine kinase/phosphomethylpyrimidine kinase [Olsenella sp.]MCI1289924.1 bifunctional hydroxymethylpyrimidine kinase/phosphomethylpyrimidine kinase [Olsenella sp.]
MEDQILLINDMCGYGKVALAAMLPVLTHMGYRIHNLPTALVSDTLNYPKFYIHDCTEYVRNTLPIWDELGFSFDAISTGFIQSEEESRIIADFCERHAAKGTRIFVDPIMADHGRLYAGIPQTTVKLMRRLVSLADCTVPNYTEACLLTDTPIDLERGMSQSDAVGLVDGVRDLGAKSVVITSALVEGRPMVIGYDHRNKKYFSLPIKMVPVYFPGTGDIFSSVLIGHVMRDMPLDEATSRAMEAVRKLIVRNQYQDDKSRGIPIETCLDALD